MKIINIVDVALDMSVIGLEAVGEYIILIS